MNALRVFVDPEFGEIRTVEVNGEPWFVGKDVTHALGYGEGKSLFTFSYAMKDLALAEKLRSVFKSKVKIASD